MLARAENTLSTGSRPAPPAWGCICEDRQAEISPGIRPLGEPGQENNLATSTCQVTKQQLHRKSYWCWKASWVPIWKLLSHCWAFEVRKSSQPLGILSYYVPTSLACPSIFFFNSNSFAIDLSFVNVYAYGAVHRKRLERYTSDFHLGWRWGIRNVEAESRGSSLVSPNYFPPILMPTLPPWVECLKHTCILEAPQIILLYMPLPSTPPPDLQPLIYTKC